MSANSSEQRLKVAVLGAGPAGLGVAIELSKLPFVEWDVYEKKPIVSEKGGGISLQPQTWKLLEKNGAVKHLDENDFFRSKEGHLEQRQTERLESYYLLQIILRISHQVDGFVDDVDLLIAADGIRTFVRAFTFPDYTLSYKGQKVYRATVSQSDAKKIDGIPWAPTFWKHVSGLYVYTCPLGDDDIEVTARFRPPKVEMHLVSWGQPFNLQNLLHEYDDFCLPIRQVLRLAAKRETQEFSLFSGPRLEHMVSHGSIALIGDTSHALLGHFGSGAGCALEDAYTLAQVLEWGFSRSQSLADALEVFDRIRSPHYVRLYEILDRFASVKKSPRVKNFTMDEEIAE
ncbi:hypothetical protein FHL15_005606 [Xylaria flabelliformis]|uniref:FAD-binding domain-containing protein n=1 Tax=Xylaria flabelliformis TaxID=2512241 RepID=A0A553I0A2_9PEZI|nr:hypothetical protein FHL15_005606 [Xylaria flabelliformis]